MMRHNIITLLKFDLKRYIANSSKALHPFIFYVIIVFTFPLTTNTDLENLKAFFPSILTISLLFASLISANHIFDEDVEDGFLEQIFLFGVTKLSYMISKIILHWIIVTLPIIITSPIIFKIFNIDFNLIFFFLYIISLVSLMISAIGIFSSCLTIGIKNATALTTIIAIPLTLISVILLNLSLKQILNPDFYNQQTSLFLLVLGFVMIVVPLSCFFGSLLLKEFSSNFGK